MNFLFGLIPAIIPLIAIASAYKFRLVGKKGALATAGVVIALTSMYSVQTYGPRIALDRTALPTPLHSEEIVRGAEMVEFKDRKGAFDDLIEAEPVETAKQTKTR